MLVPVYEVVDFIRSKWLCKPEIMQHYSVQVEVKAQWQYREGVAYESSSEAITPMRLLYSCRCQTLIPKRSSSFAPAGTVSLFYFIYSVRLIQ